MNVTRTTRTVDDFSFKLTAEDLERYLADPQAWADDTRAQLSLTAPESAAPTAPAPRRKVSAAKKTHAGRGAARGRLLSKQPSRKPSKPTKATLVCPVCQKTFTQPGRLSNHLKKMHPEQSA